MKLAILLFGFSLLFFCSCQKEIEPLNITNRVDSIVAVTNDSTFLVKYVDLDTTLPSGLDTSIVQTYQYDSRKRVVQSEYIEYLNLGRPQRSNQILLFYNGSDTFPYKKTDLETYLVPFSTPSNYAATGIYTFTNGRLTGDSLYSTSTSGIYAFSRTFVYTSNRITETTYRYTPALITEVHNIFYVKNGNNTISQTDTITAFNPVPQRFSFVYDSQPNAFYHKLPAYISDAAPYYTMETQPEEMTDEANNPVEINEYSGTLNFHIKIAYQYRANGYPCLRNHH